MVRHLEDCFVCGCHDARETWQDEDGLHSECNVCEGCKDVYELAKRMKIYDYMVELYLDGIRKERELVEVLQDKLAENKNIPDCDIERLATEIVQELYDEVKVEAETELQEGLENWREMMDVAAGRY